MNKVAIIISLILALVLGLGGCVTVNETAPAESTAEQPPEYHTLSFTLEGKGHYSFPIYLRNNETLHFMMSTESEGEGFRVYIHILTPSGETIGSYGAVPEVPGQYANGTLDDFACQSFKFFVTQFSPSDYDWGEGYYRMEFVNESREPGTVKVEYWIED